MCLHRPCEIQSRVIASSRLVLEIMIVLSLSVVLINIVAVVEMLVFDTLNSLVLAFVVKFKLLLIVSYFAYMLFDVAVDALTDEIMCFVQDIGFEVLADANVTVFAFVTPALEFTAPFACWILSVFNCDRALQAQMPSNHVCRSFALAAPPQFPNQEAPRPQQLLLPDFTIVPHLGHMKFIFVVIAAALAMGIKRNKKQSHWSAMHLQHVIDCHRTYVCRPSRLPTTCAQRFCHQLVHSF